MRIENGNKTLGKWPEYLYGHREPVQNFLAKVKHLV